MPHMHYLGMVHGLRTATGGFDGWGDMGANVTGCRATLAAVRYL